MDVGIVVGRAGAEVDEFDAEVGAFADEADGFTEVGFDRVVLVYAECVFVGTAVREIFRDAGAGFAGRGKGGVGTEGDEVESAEADAEVDFVSAGADAGDDFAEEAGAIFEGAAVFAGAGVGAEEFVQEVAVAMFDVDEIGAGFGGEGGGGYVILD